MIKRCFTLALRNFNRQKGYFLLNCAGLAIALAVATLILLYVRHERSYDQTLPRADRTFRLYKQWNPDQGNVFTPAVAASTLTDRLPDVAGATWVLGYGETLLAHGGKSLYVEGIAVVDTNWLDVMALALRAGNAKTALHRPYSAVLSAALAGKFFGDDPHPVGKTLRLNDEHDYTVTGVLAPPEGPTHLRYEAYLTDPQYYEAPWQHWTGNNVATYVALQDGVPADRAERNITDLCNQFLATGYRSFDVQAGPDDFPAWRLQPVRAIHLHSTHLRAPDPATGRADDLYIFMLVAAVLLLIAGINYVNLATAQAARRAREVAVRKVSGATKGQLVTQFLLEAVGQTLLALPPAWLLAELALPRFNQMTARTLTLDGATLLALLPWLLLLVGVTGLGVGFYPALFLARYRPATVLKGGKPATRTAGGALRRGLVVAQFALAMVSATVMVFIYQQVRFMQNQELGFQANQVVVVPLNGEGGLERFQSLKQELLRLPGVQQASATSTMPGQPHSDYAMDLGGEQRNHSANIYFADPDFAEVMGLALTSGRFFLPGEVSDSAETFVVNEAFVREFQLKAPIGHPMRFVGSKAYGTIVGVAKDFHYRGLDRKILPLVFSPRPWQGQVAIRVAPQNVRATVAALETFWRQVEPAHPLRYSFLDDDFAALYGQQERFGQTLLYATLLTLFVAALGMFGLASFLAEQRTKEIGVRKVLGATVGELVLLLGRDFLGLVVIAALVAAPLAWWLARRWLADFAYRAPLGVLPFVAVGGAALLIAALAVSYHSVRAARANPVHALRSE